MIAIGASPADLDDLLHYKLSSNPERSVVAIGPNTKDVECLNFPIIEHYLNKGGQVSYRLKELKYPHLMNYNEEEIAFLAVVKLHKEK